MRRKSYSRRSRPRRSYSKKRKYSAKRRGVGPIRIGYRM